MASVSAALKAARPVMIDPERPAVRLMGTRFVLDSWVLDQLLAPNVGTDADPRLLPSRSRIHWIPSRDARAIGQQLRTLAPPLPAADGRAADDLDGPRPLDVKPGPQRLAAAPRLASASRRRSKLAMMSLRRASSLASWASRCRVRSASCCDWRRLRWL